VSPVKYELGFYIPEDDILHSHRREELKSYRSSYFFRELFCLCASVSDSELAAALRTLQLLCIHFVIRETRERAVARQGIQTEHGALRLIVVGE
jgi:hypothetical protein